MNENDLKKDDMNSLDDMLKEAPSLSFDMPEVKPEVVEIKEEKKNETPEVKLSPEEEKMVEEFASKIDIQFTGNTCIWCGKSKKDCGLFGKRT